MIKQISNVRVKRVNTMLEELELKAFLARPKKGEPSFLVSDLVVAHESDSSPDVAMGEHITIRGRRNNVDMGLPRDMVESSSM